MSDYMIEPGSFEARVREEVLRLLRSPLSLPPEFRSWLVPFIESSNVQLPISQIVGNFLVSDTADGLGGKIHGRTGMIRSGTAPYDYMQVTFDGVTQKWVSNPILIDSLESGVSDGVRAGYLSFYGFTQTAYNSPARRDAVADLSTSSVVGHQVGGGLPHKEFVDAGFKVQIRLYIAAASSPNTTNTTLIQSDADFGGSLSALVTPSWTVDFTSGTVTLKDSGWQDLASSITSSPKDMVFVQYAQKAATGTPIMTVHWIAIYARYITP